MFGLELDESDDEEFSGDNGWIGWFCGLKGHEFVIEVEEEYIRDNFNLYGLRGQIQYYDQALEMILGEAPDEEDLADTEFLEIYRDATELYGCIHARYIVSPRGLQVMKEKYAQSAFGTCPRALCERQRVLPIGILPETGKTEVQPNQSLKIFCPKCEQVYAPKNKHKDVEGFFFAMSFPQIFLQTYPLQQPLEPPRPYVPRVFGFKIHGVKSLIARKLDEEEISAKSLMAAEAGNSGGGGAAGSSAVAMAEG